MRDATPLSTTMVNARALGMDETVDSICQFLVDEFRAAGDTERIGPAEPLVDVGVGLSSMEGVKIVSAIKERYGVVIDVLDYWIGG